MVLGKFVCNMKIMYNVHIYQRQVHVWDVIPDKHKSNASSCHENIKIFLSRKEDNVKNITKKTLRT